MMYNQSDINNLASAAPRTNCDENEAANPGGWDWLGLAKRPFSPSR